MFVLSRAASECEVSIYVYPMGEENAFDRNEISSVEPLLFDLFSGSPCAVTDPTQASFFFVPVYPTLIAHSAVHGVNLQRAYSYTTEVHEALLRTSPYYSRRNGTDHIFVVAHDG